MLEFLQKLNEEGNTIVMITHDNSIAVTAKRIIRLHDGKIVYDGPSDSPEALINSSVSFEDDPLLKKKREEAKKRDEAFKKAMAQGMSFEEFEKQQKELEEQRKAREASAQEQTGGDAE